MESLSTLKDSTDLCGRGVGEAIMNMRYTFPKVVQEWRDSYRVKGGSEHPWSTFEKTKSVLEHLVKVEEGIRTKLEELDKKEKELEAQVEAVESESRKLKEEREELSNQTKIIFDLVKELAQQVEPKVVEVDRDNHTVEESLKAKWATTRQLFA
ncbi:unnamed protein product [Cuscuta epithymum]|nr:unnamed protein product [Cuscuta epithymum]